MVFKITYLYIKTHNITGLKYFGKTTKNPVSYKGSGKYWLKHLRKHGNNIRTEVIGEYTDEQECKEIAINFSKLHNIVDSDEWANLCIENGTDGGYRPNNHCKILNTIPRNDVWNKNISTQKTGKRTVCKPVLIDGLKFDAMIDAAKYFNVREGVIYYWIKIGRAVKVSQHPV